MLIQIRTDKNVQGREDVTSRIEDRIRETLERYDDRLTRVEAHLADENSAQKSGDDDLRCTIEMRFAGMQPIAVSANGANLLQAVDEALEKALRAAETAIGRGRGY